MQTQANSEQNLLAQMVEFNFIDKLEYVPSYLHADITITCLYAPITAFTFNRSYKDFWGILWNHCRQIQEMNNYEEGVKQKSKQYGEPKAYSQKVVGIQLFDMTLKENALFPWGKQP